MNDPFDRSSARAVAAALGLYATWVVFTYMLEGRLHTFLRPDAAGARLTYTVVANILIGTAGGIWILSRLVRSGLIMPDRAGFAASGRTIISVLVGLLLGFLLYGLQGAPSWHPVVLSNVFAQVLVVSAAEVIVCWVVIGGVLASLLKSRGWLCAYVGAIVTSSLLFGLYHFAHSPPFNTTGMVLLLSGVGLATGLFYFISRDVYGTLIFHTMLALYGVVGALASERALDAFERPVWPLIATALATLLLLAAGHGWLRRRSRLAFTPPGAG